MIHWLSPQPAPSARPTVCVHPLDDALPHPLAVACADQLMHTLKRGDLSPGVSTTTLTTEHGGKMFGVLVVQNTEGRVGYLQGFSGQFDSVWNVPGFVPPLFDTQQRDAVEGPAEAAVSELTTRVNLAEREPALLEARLRVETLDTEQRDALQALKAVHTQRKQARRTERVTATDQARLALDQQSRADAAERRHFDAAAQESMNLAMSALHPLERRLAALKRLRQLVSHQAMCAIFDRYTVTNFASQSAPLRSFFTTLPPSGAGDCVAPKLFETARRLALKPLALAEFWWGRQPRGGGRVQGAFFRPCAEKCVPILEFQLHGLTLDTRRRFAPSRKPADDLSILWRHTRCWAVEKPEGVLSVPSRDLSQTDSVLARVRALHPSALLVHRLDLDTSGVLLVALDIDMYKQLQAQFLNRSVEKQYLAVLDGDVHGDAGTISLPVCVDFNHRPRQMVDLRHGKVAVTHWTVSERANGQTRMLLVPETGRTHQLRVHAAHADGLNAPVVGDRLYGHAGPRLLLHAQSLRFTDPTSGSRVEVVSPCAF